MGFHSPLGGSFGGGGTLGSHDDTTIKRPFRRGPIHPLATYLPPMLLLVMNHLLNGMILQVTTPHQE